MTTSPLRYPGGKGKLYKHVRQIIVDNELNERAYTEPFAGGFGIGIKLLSNSDVNHAIINDFDYHIYAIWHCVFFDTQSFIDLIRATSIDLNTWEMQKHIYKNYNQYSILEIGFSAFYLNRTNYSGVLSGGPIGGTKQDGKYQIDCRFNKSRLIQTIEQISLFKDSVELYNMDINDFIDNVISKRRDELFINFDPPYVTKGNVLYENYFKEDDHIRLAKKIKTDLQHCQWIMTYDDCDLIKKLYAEYSPTPFNLQYYAGTKRMGNELLISNLIKGEL